MTRNGQRALRGMDWYIERVGKWDCPRVRADTHERMWLSFLYSLYKPTVLQ